MSAKLCPLKIRADTRYRYQPFIVSAVVKSLTLNYFVIIFFPFFIIIPL